MIRLKFEPWVRRAVSRIILPQDRITAGRELMDHMEDHYQNLVEAELPPEFAAEQTLAAMGDANTVAEELGAIHRPFWGYLQMYSARVLRAVVCLTLVCMGGFLLARYFFLGGYDEPVYYRYDPYGAGRAFDNAGQMERLSYSAPGTSASSDGYLFTVTQTALWQETSGDGRVTDRFFFRVQVQNLLPWAEQTDILRWFWAEDSLGNRYCAAYEKGGTDVSSVQGSHYHTGPLTWLHDMYLTDYVSEDARWLDLHYHRAGRDVVLRIDLEGGTA